MILDLSNKAVGITPSTTLAITAKLNQMIEEGINVYGFGAGEPDFDTPSYIREAAIQAINKGFTRYTSAQGTMDLRMAICEKLKRENDLTYSPNQIVVSSGAKHSLSNTFAAILNPGDEVIVPVPYWVSYTEIIKLNDGVPVLVKTKKENGFKLSGEDLISSINEKTKAILINTPNNPTGSIYTIEELNNIADIAIKNNLFVISDEIYERLVYDNKKHVSIATLGDKIKELTIVINGMSKAYAMTGWRLGYTAANDKITKAMASIQSHAVSHPSTITQYASTIALRGSQDDVNNMVKEFEKRRNYMYDKLSSIDGLKCIKPEGAFYVYVDISGYIGKDFCGTKIKSSMDFANILLDKGHVAVIPGTAFGTDQFIRMSYATSMNNIVNGLNKFEQFVKENIK